MVKEGLHGIIIFRNRKFWFDIIGTKNQGKLENLETNICFIFEEQKDLNKY